MVATREGKAGRETRWRETQEREADIITVGYERRNKTEKDKEQTRRCGRRERDE